MTQTLKPYAMVGSGFVAPPLNLPALTEYRQALEHLL